MSIGQIWFTILREDLKRINVSCRAMNFLGHCENMPRCPTKQLQSHFSVSEGKSSVTVDRTAALKLVVDLVPIFAGRARNNTTPWLVLADPGRMVFRSADARTAFREGPSRSFGRGPLGSRWGLSNDEFVATLLSVVAAFHDMAPVPVAIVRTLFDSIGRMFMIVAFARALPGEGPACFGCVNGLLILLRALSQEEGGEEG